MIAGLDLSVRRKKPRASAWVQVSLSGEESTHLKKTAQLKRSAALSLLSPWTLAEVIEESDGINHRLWTHLGVSPSISWKRETTARNLAKHLRLLLGVSLEELNRQSPTAVDARRELITLCIHLLTHRLGQRAPRSYKPQQGRSSAVLPHRAWEYFNLTDRT